MSMPSRADRTVRRICTDAALACIALALSYLESLIPLGIVIPFLGVRAGFSNIAVMFAFFAVSPIDAAAISLTKILITSLLFGSPVSFVFSFFGGALAYAAMFPAGALQKRGKLSFFGTSVICASLNGVGQILAAVLFYTAAAFSYLPVMLFGGAVFGGITGSILNLLYVRTEKTVNVKA